MSTPFEKLSASFDYQVAFAALGASQGEKHAFTDLPCDDRQGVLHVTLSVDGDMHVSVSPTEQSTLGQASFRCRTFGGGGNHERTRKALLMLAVAMREDAEEPMSSPTKMMHEYLSKQVAQTGHACFPKVKLPKRKGRKERSPLDRLATAYKKRTGLRLTARDIQELVIMDNALLSLIEEWSQ